MDAATLRDLDQLDAEALKALVLALHEQVFSHQKQLTTQQEEILSQRQQLASRDAEIEHLGAVQNDVLRMVFKKGLALIATGTIAGLAAGLALTRLMSSQIWGVSPTDPWTFFVVAALILPVGLAACLFPARKATQVDPLVSLHYG